MKTWTFNEWLGIIILMAILLFFWWEFQVEKLQDNAINGALISVFTLVAQYFFRKPKPPGATT